MKQISEKDLPISVKLFYYKHLKCICTNIPYLWFLKPKCQCIKFFKIKNSYHIQYRYYNYYKNFYYFNEKGNLHKEDGHALYNDSYAPNAHFYLNGQYLKPSSWRKLTNHIQCKYCGVLCKQKYFI